MEDRRNGQVIHQSRVGCSRPPMGVWRDRPGNKERPIPRKEAGEDGERQHLDLKGHMDLSIEKAGRQQVPAICGGAKAAVLLGWSRSVISTLHRTRQLACPQSLEANFSTCRKEENFGAQWK